MRPSVGRIVHYSDTGRCLGALVTQTIGDVGQCSLWIFDPHSEKQYHRRNVAADESGERISGTWHWPERVPE